MQTFWCILVSSLNLFLLGTVTSSPSRSMEHSSGAQKSVRNGSSLCAGEQEYIQKRKQVSVQALRDLGLPCTVEEVPHIAFLASGGGQRAAVSLVGSLSQMSQDRLLDTVLYLGGVSGSTWSMAFLYSDPQWSRTLDSHMSSLLTANTVELELVLSWVHEKAQREEFSLTDVWGALTAAGIMKKWDTRKLSEEAVRNTLNPYPVYGAIEQHCFQEGPIEGQWFELTPHEAGFSELELFVETSALGNKFKGGVLLENRPEMDMIQLQGILGCALANETIEQYIPDWLNVPAYQDTAAQKYLHSYNIIATFISLTKAYVTNEDVLKHINNLQTALQDKVNRNESVHLESLSPEQREQQFQQWTSELGTVVQDWTETLPQGPVKTHVSLLVHKIIPLILRWEWGTVKNFLYQYEELPIPAFLASTEHVHLMDGGLLVNVAYPSFLGQRRDIDLIIAPEYSAGNMFETLTLARAYAAEVRKPFPQLDDKILEEEKDWPRDCYVFEGNDTAPTVVFMPLFNRRNCKDGEEWSQRMEQFSTFQKSYSPDMIKFLLETAQENMRNNKETLLREISKALQRRRARGQAGQVQPEQ
ncbi:hypothetical protein NQD34_018296 [Periophthalmus magnuspinnatus]|nr:hypothetical protein NQD34_018296 [Periophthalmus magnuspinnatus]